MKEAQSSTYESLPAPPPEVQDPTEQDSLLGSLVKRFFVPSAPSGSTQSTSNASTPQRESSPARPSANHSVRRDASPLPSAKDQLSALASAVRPSSSSSPAPPPKLPQQGGSPDPNASGITLPNGQKYTRRLRLSGVNPSVGVTVQNSERGALIQSRSSANGDHGWQGNNGGNGQGERGGGGVGSPTTSETFGGLTFANLSSIPGFPLRGGDAGEDNKSAWSVSTATHASPTVVQIFRRLQGEVCFPSALIPQ